MAAERRTIIGAAARRGLVVALILFATALFPRQILTGVRAQDVVLTITKVDSAKTRFIKATNQSVILEERTTYIAPDGRQRIETLKNGRTKNVEIVDFKEDKKIALDLEKKQAVVRSNKWQRGPAGPPSVAVSQESNMVKLGTRQVVGLALEGTLHTTTFTRRDGSSLVHSFELWTYRFPDPRIFPIILEERFEGPTEVVDRRIGAIATIQAPQSIFEIPVNFTVQVLPR